MPVKSPFEAFQLVKPRTWPSRQWRSVHEQPLSATPQHSPQQAGPSRTVLPMMTLFVGLASGIVVGSLAWNKDSYQKRRVVLDMVKSTHENNEIEFLFHAHGAVLDHRLAHLRASLEQHRKDPDDEKRWIQMQFTLCEAYSSLRTAKYEILVFILRANYFTVREVRLLHFLNLMCQEAEALIDEANTTLRSRGCRSPGWKVFSKEELNERFDEEIIEPWKNVVELISSMSESIDGEQQHLSTRDTITSSR